MTKRLVLLLAAWLCVTAGTAGQSGSVRTAPSAGAVGATGASSASQGRSVLDRYCVTCHNQRTKVAGLTLDTFDIAHPERDADLSEQVAGKLRAGAMPPVGMPRPDPATVDVVATWLETELDRSAATRPEPGGALLHRLNRVEYANAIRDLLALDIDVTSLLPLDSATFGFDNIATGLSLSPNLTSRYLSAAAKISRAAVGRTLLSPGTETYEVPLDLVQEDRAGEDLPLGSRGGTVVRHDFPGDGEYEIQIKLRRTHQGLVRGVGEPHDLEVRLDGVRVQRMSVGKDGGASDDDSDTGGSSYSLTADAGLKFRLPVKGGPRTISVAFFKKRSILVEGLMDPAQRNHTTYDDTVIVQPGVDQIAITGPFAAKVAEDTPSRRRLFSCRPLRPADEPACAARIVGMLARRAYRRPVTAQDLQPLLRLYRDAAKREGFEAGIEMAVRAVLVSPEFLFRVEQDPVGAGPGTLYRIADVDLASRLSFFLWSSIPDDELLETAVHGRLRNPAELERQVRRMLADERSSALVKNFVGQWLHLRNVATWRPDPEIAPTFDDNLRQALLRETELFFDSIVDEDRNVVDLLTADYTFLNERLARHYGIPNVYGDRFRRVSLPGGLRGGLLGHGSILMVTSYPNRTSPVIRGKYILENILGSPPPPPPPNVPELKEPANEGRILTMRERMEQHRANPACATCHARMDPLGFALENFDLVGAWRTVDESHTPIDASGVLPDGTRFNGAVELRKALIGHADEFVGTLAAKLLTYGLGRGLTYLDAPTIRAIKRDAKAHDNRFSALILGVVRSTPFQMRRSLPAEGTSATSTQASAR
jgi:mono/diheme cytochrome c family protein